MQNQFLPCKIVDRQWAEKLLDGEVFMRPLFEFGVWEKTNEINDPNRKDIMEGAVASFTNPDTVPFLKNLDPAFKSAIKNVTLIDMGDLQFFKVFCLYCLEFKENKPILPDARIKDFGDMVVVFRDFNSFLLRFFQTILSRYEEHVVLLDRINYYGINENRNLNPLFEKTKRYAYQNELRLAFCLSEKNKFYVSSKPEENYRLIWDKERMIINVGDIRDIAYAIPTSKFLDGSGILRVNQNLYPFTGNPEAPYDNWVINTRKEMAHYHPTLVTPMITITGN